MSSTAAANNSAAMAAAAKGMSGAPLDASAASVRRPSKSASHFRGPVFHSGSPAMASSVPNPAAVFGQASSLGAAAKADGAVTDGPPLSNMHEHEKASSRSRIRRASEGSRKTDGKRPSGSELKCEKCGKGYKHSSCLTKHLSVAQNTMPMPSHILSQLKTNALSSNLVGFRPLFCKVLR